MLMTGRPGTPAFGGPPVEPQQQLQASPLQLVAAVQGPDAENEAPAGLNQHMDLKEAVVDLAMNPTRRVLRPLQPDTNDCGSTTFGGGSSRSMLRAASDGDFLVIAPCGRGPLIADEAAKLGGAPPRSSTQCSRRPRHERSPPQVCRRATASASSTPSRASWVGPGLVHGRRGDSRTRLVGSHSTSSFGNEFACSTSGSSFATRDFIGEQEQLEAHKDAAFCAEAALSKEHCVKAELVELRALRSELAGLREAHHNLCAQVQTKLVSAKRDARLTCSKVTPDLKPTAATEPSRIGQQRSTEKEIAEIRDLISELRANQRESQHEREEVLLGLQQNILREVRAMLDTGCSQLAGASSQEAFAAAALRVAATCGEEQQRVLQAVQSLPPPPEVVAAKPPGPQPMQFPTPAVGCINGAQASCSASTPSTGNRGLLGMPQQLQSATGHSHCSSTNSSLAAPKSGGGSCLAPPAAFSMSPRLTHSSTCVLSPSVPSPSASFCPPGHSRVAQQSRLTSSLGIPHKIPSSRSSSSPKGVFGVGSPRAHRHHRVTQQPAPAGLGRVPHACWHSPRR